MADPIPIAKLRQTAKSWGGDLVRVSSSVWSRLDQIDNGGFFVAPFTSKPVGVHWPSRTIVYSGKVNWTDVIHEMGHAFATTDPPDQCIELDFFGWEHQLVKHLGLSVKQWAKANDNYVVYNTDHTSHEFGSLSPKRKTAVIRRLVQRGKKLSILDSRGRPKAVPRSLNLVKLRKDLERFKNEYIAEFTKLREKGITSGHAFERLAKSSGFASGYRQAVIDVCRAIDNMTVTPFRPPRKTDAKAKFSRNVLRLWDGHEPEL